MYGNGFNQACGQESNDAEGVPVIQTAHSLLFYIFAYIRGNSRLKGQSEWSTYMVRTT